MSDLSRIFEKLDEIKEEHSLTRETVKVMATQLTQLHKTIEGNGKSGLIQNFNEHEKKQAEKIQSMVDCFREHENQEKFFKYKVYAGLAFIAAGGAASGTLFFDMLSKAFKIFQFVH